MLGITEKSCSEPITKGADFEVYQTVAGTEVTLNKRQCEQRRRLVSQIESRGFEAVVEEVAYTWFNRICAIRFMEVNDYMWPERVRVLSSEKKGKLEPDVITKAPNIEWGFTDDEKEEIINLKLSEKPEDANELFRKIFLKQCHWLNSILPGLFEDDSDYMELLFGISYNDKDGVIYMLVNPETGIPESDFNVSTLDEKGNPTGQVEIIGWLYQYYNTELKDDTFAKLKKNVKITKERIPAATQLFTPDWIVRYMVENSVGRIWIEHLRAVDPRTDEKATAERFGWKYYLPEAKQEESVNVKLVEIRTAYKELKPTDITCIDPCMGSGHILIAMFDVLMDIYESVGYDKREATLEIVEHNIHGLDIDQRAYQLAYFAVMMKCRGYNRRFFREKNVKPNMYQIHGSGFTEKTGKKKYIFDQTTLDYFVNNDPMVKQSMNNLIEKMFDAEEYGSILNFEDVNFELLFRRFEEIKEEISLYNYPVFNALYPFVSIAYLLTKKYAVVITNPPYMGASGMDAKLSKYVKENYPDSKSDLFAVFIEKCGQITKNNGYQAMITQHAWMFLSSFEKLRNKMQLNDIVNMAHLGPRAFDEIGGEVVQTTSFVIRKSDVAMYNGTYCRLLDAVGENEKEEKFVDGNNQYYTSKERYYGLPGSPIAYWISASVLAVYKKGIALGNIAAPRKGNSTSDNNRFLRFWPEVEKAKMNLHAKIIEREDSMRRRWYPYNKGGGYRKWYGFNEYLIDWYNDAYAIRQIKTAVIANYQYFMKPGLTWSTVSSNNFSIRKFGEGYIFDNGGCCIFELGDKINYLLGLLNSKVFKYIFGQLNPTLNFQSGEVAKFPIIIIKSDIIEQLVEENVQISIDEYNSYETSWDFLQHPLIKYSRNNLMEDSFEKWKKLCDVHFNKMKENEIELNRQYIQIYGLEKEISPEEGDELITLRVANKEVDIKSFVSYAVGCMFGRYSLDEEGLICAGGEWDNSKYKTFLPDDDNCIPITDEEYFSDDIVARFVEFVRTVYGADTLEENLDFIANALGNKGDTSREVIRNYFLKDFYADHLKVYQKRPIYWLFDSGKQNGFKALIYMHRYDADTVGRVRTDYLHRAQKYVETAMQSAQYTIDNATSASEKSKATKAVTKYTKQLAEMKIYDEAIAHIANKRIEIDLDDGVKVNYEKFQGVEVAQEGKKALKVDLLAKIK